MQRNFLPWRSYHAETHFDISTQICADGWRWCSERSRAPKPRLTKRSVCALYSRFACSGVSSRALEFE